jgi:hypothetical protein
MESKYKRGGRIWIDALCINQRNMAERNVQVKRMKSIYEEARAVYACVGPDLQEGERICNFINYMTAAGLESLETSRDLVRTIDDLSIWKGVIELLSRPYWGRLWIIQEVILPKSRVQLCFGDRDCYLTAWFMTFVILRTDSNFFVMKALEILAENQNATLLPSFLRSFANMERLVILDQYKYTSSLWPDLMMLLDASRNAEQSDTRDKIYALLGLMDPTIQDHIVPNYDAPVFDIYRDFSRNVIKATRKLEIIFQGGSSTILNKHYPSWISDWSLPTDDHSRSLFNGQKFCAAGNTKHLYESDGEENHLVCKGIRLDFIDSLGCNYGMEHLTSHILPSRVNSSPRNVYKNDEGLRDALWETFTIGNMTYYNQAVSALFKALPWFNGVVADSPTVVPYYTAFDRFQQLNRRFEVTGKCLEHYFPRFSEDFNTPPSDPAVQLAFNILIVTLQDRRLMETKKGYVGSVPKRTQPNDSIFLLMGCDVPLVLRPQENGLYQLVGECYVHGIMRGEAMRGWREVNMKLRL